MPNTQLPSPATPAGAAAGGGLVAGLWRFWRACLRDYAAAALATLLPCTVFRRLQPGYPFGLPAECASAT